MVISTMARTAKQKAATARLVAFNRARRGTSAPRTARAPRRTSAPRVTVVSAPASSPQPVTIIERGRALARRGASRAAPYVKAGKLSMERAVKGSIPSVAGGFVFGKVQMWLTEKVGKGEFTFLADADSVKQSRNIALACGLLAAYAATKTKGNIRQAMLAAPAVLGYLYAVTQ